MNIKNNAKAYWNYSMLYFEYEDADVLHTSVR